MFLFHPYVLALTKSYISFTLPIILFVVIMWRCVRTFQFTLHFWHEHCKQTMKLSEIVMYIQIETHSAETEEVVVGIEWWFLLCYQHRNMKTSPSQRPAYINTMYHTSTYIIHTCIKCERKCKSLICWIKHLIRERIFFEIVIMMLVLLSQYHLGLFSYFSHLGVTPLFFQ